MTMAHTSPQHRRFTFNRDDLLRGSVIALLVVLCILTTILAFALQIDILITQIFFIPIIYAVYAFPRRGIIVSAICACAYEITGYLYLYPDPVEHRFRYHSGSTLRGYCRHYRVSDRTPPFP